MKKVLLSLFAVVVALGLFAQGKFAGSEENKESNEVKWVSFEQALKLNKKHPKKIIIDVYTDWCGWCKRMDATTYKDPAIVKYINDKYYAVRLNAETRDSIAFQDKMFRYRPEYKVNEIALALLQGKMSYPTTVYLDEGFNMLSPVPGYLAVPQMSMILKYYGDEAYKTMTWEKYQQEAGQNKNPDTIK